MRPTCPVCGKAFWCDYPKQWVYKRGNQYICSWGCIRKYDRKEASEKVYRKIKKDGTPAKPTGKKKQAEEPKVELVYDESIAEEYRREQAQKEANERAREEAMTAERSRIEIQGADERELWQTAAVRNKKMGTFYYDEKFRTIDWRHPTGEEISLPPEDWKWLGDHIRMILHALGVEV